MEKPSRCVTGVCDNDMRQPELHKNHSNVDGDIAMHKLPKDKAAWIHAILKGRKDLKSEKDIHKNCYICSIHFRDSKPAKNNPVPIFNAQYKYVTYACKIKKTM